jgi:hypothetical protein
MKWHLSLLSLALLGLSAFAQESPQKTPSPSGTSAIADSTLIQTNPTLFPAEGSAESGGLRGNHNFDNFINWMSNPVQNIDPRAKTEIVPIFGGAWFGATRPLPGGNAQIYGAAIDIALS